MEGSRALPESPATLKPDAQWTIGLGPDGQILAPDHPACAMTVAVVPLAHARGAVDDPRLLETLARVIENRHGTLHGIGSTLREALAEYKRGR